jgi:hypothetical protein
MHSEAGSRIWATPFGISAKRPDLTLPWFDPNHINPAQTPFDRVLEGVDFLSL